MLMLLLYISQYAQTSNSSRAELNRARLHSTSEAVGNIPRCIGGPSLSDQCFTFAYTPNNDVKLRSVMENVRRAQGIPAAEVTAWADESAADAYLLANPNRTQAVYHLRAKYAPAGPGGSPVLKGVAYSIQYNTTEYRDAKRRRVQPLSYVVFPMQVTFASNVAHRILLLCYTASSRFIMHTICRWHWTRRCWRSGGPIAKGIAAQIPLPSCPFLHCLFLTLCSELLM